MLFSSFEFLLIFLPITWGVFQLLAPFRSTTLSALWLAAASVVFYGYWNAAYILLLLASTAVNFLLAGAIAHASQAERTRGRRLLAFGVFFNLALLGYYKYANFLVENVERLISIDVAFVHVILPIGISFYTFQQIAYLVDVHRGEAYEHNLPKYLLFICFFPQLIAGPIVHHRETMPQFGSQRRGDILADAAIGLTIFVIGLCKKVLVADTVAAPANAIFNAAAAGASPGFADCWIAALCYTFQIYFDFSGYSDMAIGLARMFGIRLPMNFASPYKATSIIDFWRRWHITLSRFLRTYLYVPLGGSALGARRRYANVFVTMVLGGIWHGAGWTFLLWGTVHGLLILANHSWRAWRRGSCGRVEKGQPWKRTLCRVFTFLIIVWTWVPFRASNLETTIALYAGMLGLNGAVASSFLNLTAGDALPADAALVLFGLPALTWIVWRMPNTQEIMRWTRPTIPTEGYPTTNLGTATVAGPAWTGSVGWAVLTGILMAFCLSRLNDASEFIYFQF